MKEIDWKYELKSTAQTFLAIFTGTLLASPLINALLGTDLPTIQQLHDVIPLAIDTMYRAAWLTFLTKIGLSHRKTLTNQES